MPNIPKRVLSYGENLEKQRKLDKRVKKETQGTKSTATWEKPTSSKHGFVKVLPKSFYVCSICKLDCLTRKALDIHWETEH